MNICLVVVSLVFCMASCKKAANKDGSEVLGVSTASSPEKTFTESLENVIDESYIRIISSKTDKSLRLAWSSDSSGDFSAVVGGSLEPLKEHQWRVERVNGTIVRIATPSRYTNGKLYLVVKEGKLQLTSEQKKPNSDWEVQPHVNGFVKFKNVASKKFLMNENGKLVLSDLIAGSGAKPLYWNIDNLEKLDAPYLWKTPGGRVLAHFRRNHPQKLDVVNEIWERSGSSSSSYSWKKVLTMADGRYAPTFFNNGSRCYMIYAYGKQLVLRESRDDGKSWGPESHIITFSETVGSGGGGPVFRHNGYLYYGFIEKGGTGGFPKMLRVIVARAPAKQNGKLADLTKKDLWKETEPHVFPKTELTGTREGWLEPLMIKDPSGALKLIARVDSLSGDIAAVLDYDPKTHTLSFEDRYISKQDLIDFEGRELPSGFIQAEWAGSDNFFIQYIQQTGKYWIIGNIHRGTKTSLNFHKMVVKPENEHFYDRNELAVYSTEDFRRFKREAVLIKDDLLNGNDAISANYQGFQQPVFLYENKSLLIISRTSYGGFDNYHDANMITTHRFNIP